MNKVDKIFLLFFIGITIFYFFNVTRYPVFWMDEAWDISVAWSFVKKGIFGNPTYPLDGLDKVFFLHPPLPILLEVPLIKLFGITPLTIRFFSILCGLGSILILYLLTKRIFDEKVAFWSALFLAFNPLFFLMSRQLRPEIYVTFFTVLSFYLYRLAQEKENFFFYFLTGISCSLSFLSHYYGAFIIVVFGFLMVYELIKQKSKSSLKNFVMFLSGVFVIVLPFFIWILKNFEFFKIQFLNNLSNLTGISKLLDTFIKEKERYLKYPEAIGLVGFGLMGLILFFKKILMKTPELMMFYFIFLIGLAFFMPNKTVIYLVPIIPLTSLLGGLMLTSKPDFLNNDKFNLAVRFVAFGFLLVSLLYTFKPKNINAYFNGIPYSELNNKFNLVIERYYQNGTIVGDPTYFLFLKDSEKNQFISEHVLFQWIEANPAQINQIFLDKNIKIFVYSPYWWNDWCRNNLIICDNLKTYLENQGVLLSEISRGGSLTDYVYLIK